jgi:streptogramin lyase
MKTKFQTVVFVIVMSMLMGACGGTASPTVSPAPTATAAPTAIPTEAMQIPAGIWEGAQEAGDNDWSLSLNFDGCTGSDPCAKVYYLLCAGEFAFQKAEAGKLLFQENITEHPDQCFSGANVQVEYQGQDQPMIVSWMGDDGNAFTTAEMHYQDPDAHPAIEGLGEGVDVFHFAAGGYTNFGSFVAANGNLWIPDSGHGKVIRYDIAGRKIVAEIQVGDPAKSTYGDPQMVAVSGDSIWVAQCAEKKLARIDPATDQIVDSIQLDVEPYALVIDGNILWVTSFEANQVLRVDLQTKEITAIQDIENALGVAVGGGSVWVAEHRTGNLVRMDPNTGSVIERIHLPDGSTPENVIFAEGSAWVANNLGNSISRVDAQTNAQTVISLPQRAVNVSMGGGFIWVALHPQQDAEIDLSKYQLAKIDPSTDQVEQVFDFPGAAGSAFSNGVLWIVNRNDMSGDKLHGVKLVP